LVDNYDFKTVLDVGCGKGKAIKIFCSKKKKAIGIDVSSRAVATANKLKRKCTFGSALDIPFGSCSFDV